MRSENTAVIVVDIQERLLPVMNEAERLTAQCKMLLEGAQILELPILATEQYSKGLGPTIEPLRGFLVPERTYEKKVYSFAVDELLDALGQLESENVIVIGIETHVCVFQGVRQMLEEGFQVYVPVSCVSSRTVENKENALAQLRDMGAHITNLETVLFDILHTADHPQFKAISKLIK